MLDYIRLDWDLPILPQLPNGFKSAAILFHPFIQMPYGWEKSKRENPYQHIYPSDEEMINLGESISWIEVMSKSNLKSYKELSLALQTSTGALRYKYEREDLANLLNSYLETVPDLYYPDSDCTSLFIIDSLLKILCSKGANTLYFSEPIHDTNGSFKVSDISPLEIANLSPNESIITDENMDFAFMGIYDSFITLLLAKDTNIKDIIKSQNLEALICDKEISLSWFL
ncbi:hypothetical protein CN978_30785 [Priestia megaterium]|uniref:DUF2711 family protein n=1 Tax=Priestia megaterium TaxID=1404 RepID=UPI000BFCBEE5|nr:DUF2711 family protein [Priestia megaterium]MBV6738511.1 DUF2711 domain-containing protein [Priestia megaterium]PGN53155.1 hypothetical protein CN978_30785 [Priestia megaterium]